MRLEVLHVPDCPNLSPILERLAQVTDLPVVTRVIESDAEAVQFGMAGSPTLLVDGVDPFAVAGEWECGVACRLYRNDDGRIVSAPSVGQLRAAISRDSPPATEVLSAWRTRALPLDAVERAAHQAILRAFATTGCPPASHDLDQVAAGSATQVLHALHDVDAIRLTSCGEIAVAYPFSAVPTRHHVRIGDHIDVYAMCAVDALGIAPMLKQDTVIGSVDVTNGQPISVVTRDGLSTWEPGEAVVFIGADAGGVHRQTVAATTSTSSPTARRHRPGPRSTRPHRDRSSTNPRPRLWPPGSSATCLPRATSSKRYTEVAKSTR